MYCAKINVDNIYACVKYYVCQQKRRNTFDRLLTKRNFATCLHKKFRLLKKNSCFRHSWAPCKAYLM